MAASAPAAVAETPQRKKAAAGKVSALQVFAEKVRDSKKLKSRWAFLKERKIEYFTGEDFAAFVRDHSEIKKLLGPDADLDVEDIANALISKNLMVRFSRVTQGKEKVSYHQPVHMHIEICQEQIFTENDGFFAWLFMRRVTLWETILPFLYSLIALAVCLFPFYPYQCKIVCAGSLLFVVSLLILRGAIFGALYVTLGKRVWFFPNINTKETTFRELIRLWPNKEEGEPPKWTSRLAYAAAAAAAAVLMILLLKHHTRGQAGRLRYQKFYNIFHDVLGWFLRLALPGWMMDEQPNVGDFAFPT